MYFICVPPAVGFFYYSENIRAVQLVHFEVNPVIQDQKPYLPFSIFHLPTFVLRPALFSKEGAAHWRRVFC